MLWQKLANLGNCLRLAGRCSGSLAAPLPHFTDGKLRQEEGSDCQRSRGSRAWVKASGFSEEGEGWLFYFVFDFENVLKRVHLRALASEDPSSNAGFVPLTRLKSNPFRNRNKLGLCSLGVLEAHCSGHLSPRGLRAPVPQARCKIGLSVQVEAGSREVDWSSSHPGVQPVLLKTIISATFGHFGASSLSDGESEAQGELRPAPAWWSGFILTPQGSLMPNPELVLCSMCIWRTVCVCLPRLGRWMQTRSGGTCPRSAKDRGRGSGMFAYKRPFAEDSSGGKRSSE